MINLLQYPWHGTKTFLGILQALPQLVPKTEVEFRANLGTVVSKSIELKHPSSKPITYYVTLEGSSDFRAKSTEVTEMKRLSRVTIIIIFTFTGFCMNWVVGFCHLAMAGHSQRQSVVRLTISQCAKQTKSRNQLLHSLSSNTLLRLVPRMLSQAYKPSTMACL